MKILLFSSFLLLLFAACSNNQTSSKDVLADSSSINLSVLPSSSALPASPAIPVQVSPVNNTIAPKTESSPSMISPVTTNSTVSAALNPAHGQPGHRCDIPIGSPLNSKSLITSGTSTTAPATNPVTVNSTTKPVATAPGMNPAHGQPGHRCDIPIGSPLNSKPATTPTVTTSPVVTTPSTDSIKQ